MRRPAAIAFTAFLLGGTGNAVPDPPSNCASDRVPPTAAVVSPAQRARIAAATITLKAAAADAGAGVARVRFYADQLGGSHRFRAEDTEAPYEVEWTLPAACGAPFAIAVDAEDACGNLVSPPSVFVTVETSCAR